MEKLISQATLNCESAPLDLEVFQTANMPQG